MKRLRGVFPAPVVQGEAQRHEPREADAKDPTRACLGHCHLLQPFLEGKLRHGPQLALRFRFSLSSCVAT